MKFQILKLKERHNINLGNTSGINYLNAISYFEKGNDIRVIVLHREVF